MEPSPAFDVSRPSPLRVAGFLVTALGALLAGVSATLTWVTVGIEGAGGLDTPTKGLDIWDGKVVLACAVVMLIAVLVTRMASSLGLRRGAAGLVIAAGLVTLAVGAAFVMTASSRFEPVADDELVASIAQAAGVPEDQVRATFEDSMQQLGAFTEVGPGPYVAIAGGLAGLVGGILVLAWTGRPEETDEPAEDASPTGSDVPNDA